MSRKGSEVCRQREVADGSALGEPLSLLALRVDPILFQRHEFGEDITPDSAKSSNPQQVKIQILLGNEPWLRKQPRPLLEGACLMHGIQEINKNRPQLVNALMSLTIAISNAKEAAEATTACVKNLRWLKRSTLAKLPWFILEGICSKCGLTPSVNSTETVNRILQWVRPKSLSPEAHVAHNLAASYPGLEL